nr:MAG TPA: protein of unknown function (DUF3127) [Caudoviricetes sp.]
MADITGKIIAVLPTRSGTSARGTQWSSQTAVIETHERYPKMVAFDVLGDKITEFNLQVGEEVTVSFDINAREFNGKWFNSVNAWQVIRQGGQQAPMQGGYNMSPQYGAQAAQQAQQAAMAVAPNHTNPQNLFPPAQPPAQPQGNSSDLPF